jgi:hypothetical protein
MLDLPIIIAVLFECTMKKFQFPWETFLVTLALACAPKQIVQSAYWLGHGVTQCSVTGWCEWASCMQCALRHHPGLLCHCPGREGGHSTQCPW